MIYGNGSNVAEAAPVEIRPDSPTSSASVETRPGSRATGFLTVRPIRSPDALIPLRPDWNRLAGEIPFRRWEWLVPWWNHFQNPRDELLVLAVSDETAEVVAIAPWFVRVTTLRGRVIRFLGSGLACSDYVSILHAPGYERPVADALDSWLRTEGPRYNYFEFAGVTPGDAAVRRFLRRLHERGHLLDHRFEESCWRIELPDSWEAYLRSLSKSRREKVRQLTRRVLDTDAAEIRVADSPESVHDGLEILAELHQKRRQSLDQPGSFASPRFRAFLGETAERFFEARRLRLQWIELEGRPVVAEIDFTSDRAVYMYQSGMDPDFARERPGWLGTIASLRHAIDRRYRYYDFLRGDESYKSHWRGEPEPLTLMRAFPNTLRARLTRLAGQARRDGLAFLGR